MSEVFESLLNGTDVRQALSGSVSVNESASFDDFIEFISGMNAVLVQGKADFDKFIDMLKDHKCEQILGRKWAQAMDYAYWQDLADINRKNRDLFLFEYQPGKGLSWSDDIKQVASWYGRDPIEL